jgi:drug/metabolite transporter (DMT)-like permease
MSLLILVSALMGASFLFIRVAAPTFGPVWLIDLRVLLSAGALALWAVSSGQALKFHGSWRDWLLLGSLNTAIPFTLVAWGELRVNSSLTALLMATIPLFTALVSALWLREGITAKKAVGIGLGLLGVVIASGWATLNLDTPTLLSLVAIITASLLYAIGSVFTKVRFQSVPSTTVTVGNLATAGVVLLPFAAFTPPPALPPASALMAFGALVLVATVPASLLYFRMIERTTVTSVSTVAYLIPVFGALWGALFLNEMLTADMLLGFSVILASVALVTDVRIDVRWSRRLFEITSGLLGSQQCPRLGAVPC